MKGGRPAVFLGYRAKDKRIRYFKGNGRTRAFYARWRKNLQRWECHLEGYGLQPRQWFSSSQTMALSRLRMTQCLWDWRPVFVDKSVRWDGIEDIGYAAKPEDDGDLFPRPKGGAGDASPAVTHREPQVVDHDGLEVGELPADQLELFFPAHASREGGA